MCFKDDTPPQERVIDSLLSLLFIQKELLRDASQSELSASHKCKTQISAQLCTVICTTAPSLVAEHREHTKSLSPFEDVVDKTPVIRSVLLKLLLKYRSVALI